ncbi:hypothetical protein [Fructobacillus ficulneus]|uniref:Uncharacterized protein n=1 Tax=Fructobacillus ficulneus TaxID=157463 RepID=A0A0K8MG76_9LACO|nr:hypothetical protein [Fructobacillus ficulneus]GAO99208.1 hypothetical protein FFIC_090320 [Fructobacillus ficulneus]
MKQRNIIRHYFTGYGKWSLDGLENLKEEGQGSFKDRYAEENYNFWIEVHRVFDAYTATLPPEIVNMEREHYRERIPFGQSYNVVAPTAVIQEVNNELNRLAKSIEQPERIKQVS